MTKESPDTVHGRLLESVHISGYTFERACDELEWLLEKDRWKQCGRGFTDIRAFLATMDFSNLKGAVETRTKIAKRLQALDASQRSTAKLLGVGKDTVARDLGVRGANTPSAVSDTNELPIETGANTPEEWFQREIDPARTAKRDAHQERVRVERPHVPPPPGRYRLIYADPPWRYEHVETENRAIENQYPTMALDELAALTVPAADAAVLFLWATSPKLAEALHVVDRWGFAYRTCAVWDKTYLGMGYYFRQQHELLLVATRGGFPVPEADTRPPSIIRSPRGRHSAKPEQVYMLLETMYPTLTATERIELFARQARDGWAQWTNEPIAV